MVKMRFILTVAGFQSQMTKIHGYNTPMMTNLTSFGDCQHGVLVLVTKLACGWQNIGSNFNRNMTKIDGIHTKKENQMKFIIFLGTLIRFLKNIITWKILLLSMFWESGQGSNYSPQHDPGTDGHRPALVRVSLNKAKTLAYIWWRWYRISWYESWILWMCCWWYLEELF